MHFCGHSVSDRRATLGYLIREVVMHAASY